MPNLSFVVRHVEGETITPTALTQDQSEAICSCWRRSPTTRELLVAEAVFRQCKTARAWLACDCRGKGTLPLMSVFRRDDKLYLRRMTDRAAHSGRCLFFKDSARSTRTTRICRR